MSEDMFRPVKYDMAWLFLPRARGSTLLASANSASKEHLMLAR